MNNPATIAEHRDLMKHLCRIDPKLIAELEDPENYTAKGKLVVKRVADSLGVCTPTVSRRLDALRQIVAS